MDGDTVVFICVMACFGIAFICFMCYMLDVSIFEWNRKRRRNKLSPEQRDSYRIETTLNAQYSSASFKYCDWAVYQAHSKKPLATGTECFMGPFAEAEKKAIAGAKVWIKNQAKFDSPTGAKNVIKVSASDLLGK